MLKAVSRASQRLGWGSDRFQGPRLVPWAQIPAPWAQAQPSPAQPCPARAALPSSQPPSLRLELCRATVVQEPALRPARGASVSPGAEAGRGGEARQESPAKQKDAPRGLTSQLLRGPRGSMPARPSYSHPGTTCATGRHCPEHPECQLPPRPAARGQLWGLEGGTPRHQKPLAHPRGLPKVWGPLARVRNLPGPVRGCGAAVARGLASGKLLAVGGAPLSRPEAPFQPTLPPSSWLG